MRGIYEVPVEIGSGAMIYVHTECNKGSFSHSKVDRGDINTDTQTAKVIS
jgi:hypothetical protein